MNSGATNSNTVILVVLVYLSEKAVGYKTLGHDQKESRVDANVFTRVS